METYSVYIAQLPEALHKVQSSKVPVKIYNHSGQWSGHFFQVLEIKEIKDKGYHVTVLILFDPETANATAIDLKSISMIELKTALEFENRNVIKFVVEKTK